MYVTILQDKRVSFDGINVTALKKGESRDVPHMAACKLLNEKVAKLGAPVDTIEDIMRQLLAKNNRFKPTLVKG